MDVCSPPDAVNERRLQGGKHAAVPALRRTSILRTSTTCAEHRWPQEAIVTRQGQPSRPAHSILTESRVKLRRGASTYFARRPRS